VTEDVANVLGYGHALNMTRNLDDEDSSVHIMYRTPGGKGDNPNVTIINESELYTTVIHTRRPKAKRFKRYTTSEVLPGARKHDAYITENTIK